MSADRCILLAPYMYPVPYSGLYQGLRGQNTGPKRVTLSHLYFVVRHVPVRGLSG